MYMYRVYVGVGGGLLFSSKPAFFTAIVLICLPSTFSLEVYM